MCNYILVFYMDVITHSALISVSKIYLRHSPLTTWNLSDWLWLGDVTVVHPVHYTRLLYTVYFKLNGSSHGEYIFSPYISLIWYQYVLYIFQSGDETITSMISKFRDYCGGGCKPYLLC